MPNPAPEAAKSQVLFSVPSKNFKSAVDRNKARRRAREAYRLNKDTLGTQKPLLIGFVYTAKKIESFSVMQDSMTKILAKINKRLTAKLA